MKKKFYNTRVLYKTIRSCHYLSYHTHLKWLRPTTAQLSAPKFNAHADKSKCWTDRTETDQVLADLEMSISHSIWKGTREVEDKQNVMLKHVPAFLLRRGASMHACSMLFRKKETQISKDSC
jgi:hypothetical protein